MVNTTGVDPDDYAQVNFRILNRYGTDKVETITSPRSLSDNAGIYKVMDWGSEKDFLPWKGCLASMLFLSRDPLGANSALLKPSSTPDQFRYIRRDDLPGQLLNFESDASGKVKRVVTNSNYSEKVR